MDADDANHLEDELRATSESFRAMAENVPGALFRYALQPDGSDAVEYMSPRCAELWEVPAETIVDDASRLWQMVDPRDLPAMRESIAASARTLEPWFTEWRITTPSGRRKWLEGRGLPRRHDDGTVVWNSLVLDVTERRRVEDALRSSEKRLAYVLDVSGEGLWDWDIARDVVTHNRRWLEMVGVGDDYAEHTVERFVALVHADDREMLTARMRRCLDEGVPQHTEYRMVRPDGRVIWVEDRGDVVERDPDGRPLRMIGSMADVTARKVAELELRVKDAAIESALAGIALADLDGRLTYVNPAFCRLWGLSPEQALGRPAIDFWRTPEPPQLVIETLRMQGRWSGELEGRHGDGTLFDAQVSATMVHDAAGRPVCMMGAFVDVTEMRRAQASLRRLNDELEARIEARTAELAQAKAEAERANRAKSEFLSSMSHELRTPMNAVLGFAQLLELDATLPARTQGHVREILRAGRHLLELIDEVLDLARVESGRMRLSLETVAVRPLVEESFALLAPLAASRGVALPADADGLDGHVRADRTRLKQVLMNLLSNAIKYNRQGGRVTMALMPVAEATEPPRLRFAVSDTGPGIAAPQLDELFEPFHRLGADASIEGTGIGLVITRRLVELMHGRIGVTSEVGHGSTFWFELPAAPAT
ncbi:MAG: PAS domain-containing protein [Burkholderiaceae bacterium]|jgi:hypothetical protein|nr:PAS domain-containing protein [Burkholderiaceae bacterium]